MVTNNYPIGAANDPTAPYNESLLNKVRAEVGVELGLFVDVEVVDEDDIISAVEEAIIDRFKSEDVEVNNIKIYQHDLLSKSE